MADPETPSQQPADLSSLEGLTLGTAWSASPAGSAPHERRDSERENFRGGRPPFRGQRPEGRERRFRRENDGARERPAPIEPPSLKVVFYPEEAPFKALTKAIKASKRTYELFEISRLILEKPERTAVTISQLPGAEGKQNLIFVSTTDGTVFLSETEALDHAASAALEKFFKVEEVQVEGPKGSFPVIHRCGITGKLIAPPNYHRYAQLLNKHVAQNLPNMALPAVQSRIESVKEPDVIKEWIEEMKKIRRYTLLVQSTPQKTAPATQEETTPETPAPATSEAQPPSPSPEPPAAPIETISFDGEEAAIAYLKANHRNTLVKAAPQARLTVKQLETLPRGEVRRSIEAARALQMKSPLDTANTIRGRLRRMGFCLYKQGPKGVSYLTAVKRKFRIIGQTFAPEVQQVIECIEKNPLTSDAELPKQMLGITVPTQTQSGTAPTLSAEEDTAVKKLRQTLQWLVEQGYVIHYGNGKLFVPPARQPNAPKKDEDEEESAEETAAPESAEATTSETTVAKTTPEANPQVSIAAPAESVENKPASEEPAKE